MSGKLRASHILVKHQGSRRPASWKDPSGEEIQKRTKQDAEKILNGLREVSASNSQLSHSVLTQPQEIVSESKSFAGVATEMSDCGSAQDGGWFGPGEMQEEFENGTRALAVGEVSQVVHTASGAHLIWRTG